MRRTWLAAVALLVGALTGCAAHPARSADPAVPPHLAEAELLLTQLRPEDTNYQHSPSLVSFANTRHRNAECRTDCSGFVAAVLKHTYRLSDGQVRETMGNVRPLSQHFHAAVEAGPGFMQAKHIQDVRAGDIVAIRNPSDNRNAGHVMIVAAPVRRHEPSAPVVAGSQQWDLDVIDCTDNAHSNDTRSVPGGQARTGAGRGTFRVYTDGQGTVIGHTWSDSPRSVFREQAERHLVIGRFIPPTP